MCVCACVCVRVVLSEGLRCKQPYMFTYLPSGSRASSKSSLKHVFQPRTGEIHALVTRGFKKSQLCVREARESAPWNLRTRTEACRCSLPSPTRPDFGGFRWVSVESESDTTKTTGFGVPCRKTLSKGTRRNSSITDDGGLNMS